MKNIHKLMQYNKNYHIRNRYKKKQYSSTTLTSRYDKRNSWRDISTAIIIAE